MFNPAPGPSDFLQHRRERHFYIDKTGWIAELLERGEQVVLLPRPRRFGKTLNLSTLRYFFEASTEDRSDLFAGLAIEQAAPEMLVHKQRYPVVSISFKEVKEQEFSSCLDGIRRKIAAACKVHRYLSSSTVLSTTEQGQLARLLDGSASISELSGALYNLTSWLHEHHRERVVLLIDEYDAPIEAGYSRGYYDEVIDLFRNMFGAALKDNPALFRGVLTGVQRVSKESLFSGLNNVIVHGLLGKPFETRFGFLTEEVEQVLQTAGLQSRLPEVRAWYNGYHFGDQVVYNPWSVLRFASTGELRPYWAATSSEELIRSILLQGDGIRLVDDVTLLLNGDSVQETIDDQVVLRDLQTNPQSIWSFLLFAGYLKPIHKEFTPRGVRARLAIPNAEVKAVWELTFSRWLDQRMRGSHHVQLLVRALLDGDAKLMQRLLSDLVKNVLSHHDTGKGPTAPERVYHAFVLGLLAQLEPEYRVRSERESGYGRSDVLILPTSPHKPAAVLEFKRVEEDEDAEQALDSAMQQIVERDYAAEARSSGAEPIRLYAIAFSGKQVWVRGQNG